MTPISDLSLGPLELGALLAVGLVSGVVNTLAGAGTLITLPALIFLGLPANVANATGRVGVALQSAAATLTFHRAETLDVRLTLRLLVPASLGAAAGALVSAHIDADSFQRVIAVAMIVVLALLLWGPRQTVVRARPELRVPVFLAVGFYGGFLQAGVGLFLIAALQAVEGMELVRGNATKSALVLGFTLVALGVFGAFGLVDLGAAAALSVGSALGGWLGGRLAVRGGERLIRAALVIVVLASSSRLLGFW